MTAMLSCIVFLFTLQLACSYSNTGKEWDMLADTLVGEEYIEPKISKEPFKEDHSMYHQEDDDGVAAETGDDVSSDSREQSEIFIRSIESQFTELLKLFENDVLNRDSRFQDIIQALEDTVLSMTGSLDYKYIEQILKTLLEWDSAKHMKNKQHLRVLGLTTGDLKGFMNNFFQTVKTLVPPKESSSKSLKEPGKGPKLYYYN